MNYFETLESRVLMSAGTSAVFDSTVKLDRLVIKADLLKFRTDAFAADVTLLSDRKALKGDNVAAATTVTPLIKTLHTDGANMRLQLKEDRLTEASNALADESVIVKDLIQILHDKGNATALAADRAKLKSDRIQLQNDLIAGLNSRIATRQTFHDTLFNDCQAINVAAQTDPNASAKLKTDVQTWTTDVETKLNTMASDLQSIETARTKLVADLTASQV
jgi:hypothetical protein